MGARQRGSGVRLIVLWLLLASPVAVGNGSEAIDQFVLGCASSLGVTVRPAGYRVRSFGRDAESAERLLGYIAAGEKTGTFTSPWLYEREPDRRPVVDGYTVVITYDGEPRFLLRTVALQQATFSTVTEAHSQYDGPGARPLDRWRKIHWEFFRRELQPYGLEPTPDMPVVLERFEVVCSPAVSGVATAPARQDGGPAGK